MINSTSIRKAILFSLFLLTACGYHLLPQGPERQRLFVPYVKGDIDGEFTAAIVREIASLGIWRVGGVASPHRLEVEILNLRAKSIDFRGKEGVDEREENAPLSSVAKRALLKLRVQLVQSCSGRILAGPEIMEAALEYDYEPATRGGDVERYLGQLLSKEEAGEFASSSLKSEVAACKIARWISHSFSLDQ